jgi:hypothetical protein
MGHMKSNYIFLFFNRLGTGTGSHYEQDGVGFEPPWGKKISLLQNSPHRQWRPHNLLYSVHCYTYPVVIRPGPGVDHPIPPSAHISQG